MYIITNQAYLTIGFALRMDKFYDALCFRSKKRHCLMTGKPKAPMLVYLDNNIEHKFHVLVPSSCY